MNTINLDGQVFDLVPRQTIIAEEQQQKFTMPHDLNSEIKPVVDEVSDPTPQAQPTVKDVNGIHDEIIDALNQRDMKGINKYGQPFIESNLSVEELLDYGFEKSLDDLQCNRITKKRIDEVINLLAPHEEIPFIGESLKLLRGTEEDI
ncbi:hypothetical protein [Macrococcoides bohemicum]|uniref:hypothetical protein n=1 Tax=Macrococcoides bohemicum TaxID=1903056 RepID=UPI00165DA455|nr:hypothetical protein [Macrococcus bohemicus]MBC9873682.1 hypothetical protein [Macrococcus bohemicus]